MTRSDYFLHVLDQADSTNNYAMGLAYADRAAHGEAYFTDHQLQGKGQRGKQWLAEKGMNIAISIVIKPGSRILADQFGLSVAVAMGCYEFYKNYAGDETSIKWPNDIYWRDRKAGGILIENIIGNAGPANPRWKYAVAGIGMNINQVRFDDALPNPVSLRQITGRQFQPKELARELHIRVMHWVDAWIQQKNSHHLQAYNEVLFRRNAEVTMRKNGIAFRTKVREVLENGKLLTTDLIDNHFSFGEVEWILD